MIREIHEEFRFSYGSPRVTAELRLGLGLAVNRKRAGRLMREHRIQGIYRRKGRKNLVHAATGEDLARRNFAVDAPDALWLTDITGHPTAEGKLYCAAVMGAFGWKIIGWSMGARQDTDLVISALAVAVARRQPGGNSTILHSDHGAQDTTPPSAPNTSAPSTWPKARSARCPPAGPACRSPPSPAAATRKTPR